MCILVGRYGRLCYCFARIQTRIPYHATRTHTQTLCQLKIQKIYHQNLKSPRTQCPYVGVWWIVTLPCTMRPLATHTHTHTFILWITRYQFQYRYVTQTHLIFILLWSRGTRCARVTSLVCNSAVPYDEQSCWLFRINVCVWRRVGATKWWEKAARWPVGRLFIVSKHQRYIT